MFIYAQGPMLVPSAKSKRKMRFLWNFQEIISYRCRVDYSPQTRSDVSSSAHVDTTNIENITNFAGEISRFLLIFKLHVLESGLAIFAETPLNCTPLGYYRLIEFQFAYSLLHHFAAPVNMVIFSIFRWRYTAISIVSKQSLKLPKGVRCAAIGSRT